HQYGFARLEPGVVEQHVLYRRKGDRRAGGIAQRHPRGHRHHQARRHVDEIAGEAIDVEAHDAADVLAQIVAALAAGLAGAAGQGPVHHHAVARPEPGRAWTDRGDLAGGLDADHDRHLALGKGHAAIAPEVEMIERHRLDPDLHLARGRRGRRGDVGQLKLAIGKEGKCPHASRGLAAHHQRHVLSAETERIRQRMADLGIAGGVRHDIERYRRIRDVVVDGGRQALMLQRQQCEHGLDRAGCRQRVPDHRLVRGNRNRFGPLSKHRRNAEIFHLVVLGGAGAMRVDVVDVLGQEPGILDGAADASDDRLAVGARAGAVERVRHLAAAGENAEDVRAARDGGIVALEHERGGAFGHDEAVAVLGKRLCRRLRRIVRCRERGQQREADQCLRINRAVGADAERGLGFAAAPSWIALAPDAQAVDTEMGEPLVPNWSARCSATEPNRQRSWMAWKRPEALARRRSSYPTASLAPDAAASTSRCGHSISTGATARNSGPGKSPLRPMPASVIASSATIAAMRSPRSVEQNGSTGMKSTEPAIVVLSPSLAKRVMRWMPDSPAVSLAQLSALPVPSEVMTPMPVTTTIGRPRLSRADAMSALLHLTASIRAMPSPRQWPTAVTTTWSSGPSYARSIPDESKGGNNFSRPSARQASAMFMANCGSKPWPRSLPVARTGTSGMVCSQARSSLVAGSAPLAPEITAMRPLLGGGASRCHIRAKAAVTAPAGRLERSDMTLDSRANGMAPRASAWLRASSTRKA